VNPKKIPELETSTVGDEVLVHDSAHGKVHVLNAVAGRILELCDGTAAPSEIAARVSREFGADPSVVERDVTAMLEEFGSLQLLEAAPA
jgi:PqqD family protein of HPr-rel-A system